MCFCYNMHAVSHIVCLSEPQIVNISIVDSPVRLKFYICKHFEIRHFLWMMSNLTTALKCIFKCIIFLCCILACYHCISFIWSFSQSWISCRLYVTVEFRGMWMERHAQFPEWKRQLILRVNKIFVASFRKTIRRSVILLWS